MPQYANAAVDITDGNWLDDGGAATLFGHIVPAVNGSGEVPRSRRQRVESPRFVGQPEPSQQLARPQHLSRLDGLSIERRDTTSGI